MGPARKCCMDPHTLKRTRKYGHDIISGRGQVLAAVRSNLNFIFWTSMDARATVCPPVWTLLASACRLTQPYMFQQTLFSGAACVRYAARMNQLDGFEHLTSAGRTIGIGV